MVRVPKQSGGIAAAVREFAQPLAESLGLVLWDVRFHKEGADRILLLVIDRPDEAVARTGSTDTAPEEPNSEDNDAIRYPGVTLNDCENLSRALEPLLDEADLIECSYRLQVSSPGLERKLRTAEHFKAYLGEKVFVLLQRAFEGEREYHGVLADFDGTAFTLELPDGRGITCTLSEASWVKADDFDG
jgi:ribosome maturation factor RimP